MLCQNVGLDAAEKKFGQGKVDPQKERGVNEKVTDKARGMFEKATGYVILLFFCFVLFRFWFFGFGFGLGVLGAVAGLGWDELGMGCVLRWDGMGWDELEIMTGWLMDANGFHMQETRARKVFELGFRTQQNLEIPGFTQLRSRSARWVKICMQGMRCS